MKEILYIVTKLCAEICILVVLIKILIFFCLVFSLLGLRELGEPCGSK